MANVTHADLQPFRFPPHVAHLDEPPGNDHAEALHAKYAPDPTDAVVVHVGDVFHTGTA